MDFEKLGNAIAESIKNLINGEKVGETSVKAEVSQEPIKTQEEVKTEVETVEVDTREKRIKELEDLIAQKDAIILQNTEQINALKELTSTEQPQEVELSIEELIRKGEF